MTRKPSDPLPPPETGDAEIQSIYTSVGRALSAWEGLEDNLAQLFAALCGIARVDVLSAPVRAYGTIATARGRTEMLLAAAEVALYGKKRAEAHRAVKSLVKRCSDFAARRNEIAHGRASQVMFYFPAVDKSIENMVIDETWYLTPPTYNSNKRPDMRPKLGAIWSESDRQAAAEMAATLRREGSGKFKYSSVEIDYYHGEFTRLAREAEAVVKQVLALQPFEQIPPPQSQG